MKYDLFISDFDGTLGYRPNLIAEEDIKAIKEYIEKGGVFAVCTGRMFCSIQRILKEYGLGGVAAAYQGALIKDVITEETIFEGGHDTKTAVYVVKKLLSEGVQVTIDVDDILYFQNRTSFVDFYEQASRIKGVQVNSLVDLIEFCGKPIPKILAIAEPETVQWLYNKYKDEFEKIGVALNSGADQLLEAINPACAKDSAVKRLAEYYNVPLDKVIAVGDSTNDITLINGNWHGVAVGDAKDELKAVADEITVPFSEHPVSYLLKKYCL